MEEVTPQEFSCLAMVFPKFKGMPWRKGDNGPPRRLATILLDKTVKFIPCYRSLNNTALAAVNLGDKSKTCWLKNQTYSSQFE
jgi:hypothetical protein